MVSNGSSVNGTKYKRAGWAALKTSDDTVAVKRPVKSKKINYSRKKYFNQFTKKIANQWAMKISNFIQMIGWRNTSFNWI